MADPIEEMEAFIERNQVRIRDTGSRTSLPKPPKLEFDGDRTYYWEMETSHGPLKIRLLADVAPMHVSSTMFLSLCGFYDGLSFHRVIPGFMAQGGCPLGTGTGHPGYQYEGEFSPKARHDRPGLLSMANTGRPNTDGSQFFLTFVATPHLDDHHTIFGEVVEGAATLKEIEKRGTRPGGKPTEPLRIVKTSIAEGPAVHPEG